MNKEVITEVPNKELSKMDNSKGRNVVYIIFVIVILSLSAVIVYLTQYVEPEIFTDDNENKVEDFTPDELTDDNENKVEDLTPDELTIKMNAQVKEDFIVIDESIGSGLTPDGSIYHENNSYLLGTNIGDSLTTSYQSGTYTFAVKEVNDEYILIESNNALFLRNDLVNYFTEFKINRVAGTEVEVNSGTVDGIVFYTFTFFSK